MRDLQRVIGDEARAQLLERTGRLPDRVLACVGGGSNSIGMFAGFVDDADVAARRRRGGGRGARDRPPRRAADRRRAPGVLHGSLSAILQDDDGQITEAHSVSAGLDYPGSGPEHAWLRDSGRATLRRGHRRATRSRRSGASTRLEGIIPALETAHALHCALLEADSTLDLVCCSGRGDKDLAEVLARLVSTVPASAGAERIADAFAELRQARRAHALPDGRLPRPGRVAGDRRGLRRRRAPTSSSSASRSPTRSPTAR